MKFLVVGATGRIGAPLMARARSLGLDFSGTSRSPATRPGAALHHYDLTTPNEGELPDCDTAFLLAGVAGFRQCEANAEAWRVNVDGVIACAKRLMRRGTFIVFTSSVAVEWAGNSQYGRAKSAVETFLHATSDSAIVRFDLQTPQTLPGTVDRLVDIGIGQWAGVHYL